MAQQISDVMTPNPVCLSASTPLSTAAQRMRDDGIGNVLVVAEGGERLCGLVTDRDLVIRAMANGHSPDNTTLEEICTDGVVTLSPTDSFDDAVRLMREQAIRRLPVVDGDRPVGIVSIGDLAREVDPSSALADISAAPANG